MLLDRRQHLPPLLGGIANAGEFFGFGEGRLGDAGDLAGRGRGTGARHDRTLWAT
jgi:hypothetical protein